MDSLTFVKERLKRIGRAGWDTVAEGSGVPRSTLAKIAYGHTRDPRHLTVERLATYLRENSQDSLVECP